MKRLFPILAALWALALLALWPEGARGPAAFFGWLVETGPGLGIAILHLLAAGQVGRPLADRMPRLGDGLAEALLTLCLGLAAAQVLGTLLLAAGVFGPWVGWLWLGSGVVALLRLLTDLRSLPRPSASWLLLGALLLPVLFAIGAPATGPDELQYHLRLPRLLLEHGSLHTDPQDPVSAFPRGLHVLLALAWPPLGEAAARPLALLLGLAGLLAGQRLAVRLGGPKAGLLALPVLAGAPTVLRLLAVVGSDVPLALFATVATLAALDLRDAPRFPLLLGVLGGAAFAMKLTAALFFAPVWLLCIGASLRAARMGDALRLGASALLPLLFVAPWLLANAAAGVHPLYPIVGIPLPPGAEDAFHFNQTANYGAGTGLRAWLRTPWDLFVLGTEFDRRHYMGRLGPLPLLALPGIVLAAVRSPAVRAALFIGLLGFAAWAGPLRRVAYLLPLWPVLAALTATGLHTIAEALRSPPAVALAFVTLIGAVEIAPAWRDGLEDAAVATGREDAAEVRRERASSTRSWEYLAQHADPEDTIAVAFVWEVQLVPNRVVWACAEECPTLRSWLLTAGSPEAARAGMDELGVRWLLVRDSIFTRSQYPHLSDEAFRAGYEEPLRILDELTARHGVRRFTDGLYTVWELPP